MKTIIALAMFVLCNIALACTVSTITIDGNTVTCLTCGSTTTCN